MSDSTTVITITIYPAKNGKRRIVMTGAPEGEMPEVRTGVFAELHRLVDDVWATLLKRKPQVVKVKAGKAEKSSAPDAPENDEANDAPTADMPSADTAIVVETLATEANRPDVLPVIEGDDASSDDVPDEVQLALMEA